MPVLLIVLAGAVYLTSNSPKLTPSACAACDASLCCNCQNAWTDSDKDGFTVGGAISSCFDPGAPAGYRSQPSAQPDCDDSDPTIGAAPANYGQTCTTCNSCNVCNSGTINCKGACTAVAPSLPANYGQPCSSCNACGQCASGTYGCNGCGAATPAVPTWYQDADNDGYGNPNVTTQSCTKPAQSCQPSRYGQICTGWVSNNTDCYDSNNNAHPGQTTYFSWNRGDGSFDYNCDGQTDVQYTNNSAVITAPCQFCGPYGGNCSCNPNCSLWSPTTTLTAANCGQFVNGCGALYNDPCGSRRCGTGLTGPLGCH